MDKLWKDARVFVKHQFVGDEDDKAIEKCFRDEDIKFIAIEHVNSKSNKSKIVSCVVFKILSKPPFGVYISYIAVNGDMKTSDLHENFARRQPKQRQMNYHEIGCKLMNLVQFISWIFVRDISIHLVATEESKKCYKKLGFRQYSSDIKDLPHELQNILHLENIHLGLDQNGKK